MTEYEKVIRKSMIDLGITFDDLATHIGHKYKYNLSTSIKNKNVTDAFAVPMYELLILDPGYMYKLKIKDENNR